MSAFRPERSVRQIVEEARAIRWWIDEQIAAGHTDDEIIALAPLAIGFINGDVSVAELERRVEEARA